MAYNVVLPFYLSSTKTIQLEGSPLATRRNYRDHVSELRKYQENDVASPKPSLVSMLAKYLLAYASSLNLTSLRSACLYATRWHHLCLIQRDWPIAKQEGLHTPQGLLLSLEQDAAFDFGMISLKVSVIASRVARCSTTTFNCQMENSLTKQPQGQREALRLCAPFNFLEGKTALLGWRLRQLPPSVPSSFSRTFCTHFSYPANNNTLTSNSRKLFLHEISDLYIAVPNG